ncbi:TPA: hypothetical protein HA361_05060 [Candidatus Woesearchaeota archaeon]|nr:hypothetical protein [Candidatus Woesearchaeota archaeon]
MNQSHIGIIVILLGIILASIIFAVKAEQDSYFDKVIAEKGSCFLDDGTCLHDAKGSAWYIFGWIVAASLIILGIYLLYFDKTQAKLAEHQKLVSEALKEAKEKDEFKAFLAGFTKNEQKILEAIQGQDGILQSTLRYRTGLSKTDVSLLLKSLEEREIVSKKPEGKTNKVFLRKKF